MKPSVNVAAFAQRTGPPFARTAEHPESLAQYIAALVEDNPGGEFVAIDRFGRRNATTFRAMFDRARAIAGGLPESFESDEHVAVLCFDDVLEYVASAWACLHIGLDVLPLDAAAVFTNPAGFNRRLSRLLAQLRSRAFVLADAATCSTIKRNETVAPSSLIETSSIPVLNADADQRERSPVARARSLLIPTSGTVGDPKIAVLDNHSVTNRFFDGRGRDQRVGLYNLAHHSVAGVRLILPIGQRVIHLHPLRLAADPQDWFRAIEEFSVTDIGLSSSLAAMLCQSARALAPVFFNAGSLKRISFGAEVIVPKVVRNLLHILQENGVSETQVSLVYSMTETGPIYRSIMSMSDLVRQLEGGAEISLHDCVSGWSVRCVDNSGQVVRQGEIGTIQVCSDAKLFAGYVGGDGIDPSTRDRIGWFDTGDLGLMSDESLQLKGREKSTIIVNARKITCEQIEGQLALCEDLTETTIIAAPYREAEQATDEVAIFFVAEDWSELRIADFAALIRRTVSINFGLSAKHVVAIAASDVERTATLKVRRDALVAKFQEGQLSDKTGHLPKLRRSGDESAIIELWQEALGLVRPPKLDDDFFDLGGDSLAGARLIGGVEAKYAVRIDTTEFFRDPTPRRLMSFLGTIPAQAANERSESAAVASPDVSSDVFRGVVEHVRTWRGARQFSDSLIVGFNNTLPATPIFWVFQEHREATALAAALGPGQPLYGMRSAVGLLATRAYSEESLRGILDRYLWELLAISRNGTFRLGGNCQGGIIAYYLAKRLQAIGRQPSMLTLLEWSFDLGTYEGPTEILLGRDSQLWSGFQERDLIARFASIFPRCTLHMTPGKHGKYFIPENVKHLASHLRAESGHRLNVVVRTYRTLRSLLRPRRAG